MKTLLTFAFLVLAFAFEVCSQQPSAPTRADWTLFPAKQMPAGTPVTETEAAKLADGGYAGRVLYLTGTFFVTATGENRAVLRSGAKPGPIRVVTAYPSSIPTPAEGTKLVRDETRGFLITDIRRGGDGQVTIYVRDITQP